MREEDVKGRHKLSLTVANVSALAVSRAVSSSLILLLLNWCRRLVWLSNSSVRLNPTTLFDVEPL